MNIYRIIINRILFRFFPIAGLYGFIIYHQEVTFDNVLEKFDVLDGIVIVLLVFFFYDLVKLIRKAMERKKSLRQAQLNDVPTHVDLPNKLNFLDKRMSINENSIDVSSKNKVILHLSKAKKQIEIRNAIGKKILNFSDIQFVFLEYNQYEKDTLLDAFSHDSSYDKNVWVNSIMAMPMSGNPIQLFEAKLEETNYQQLVEYQISGKYEEKSYLGNGTKIVRLISYYTNKKYLVVNNKV